jgi:hypothetical protein
MLTPAGRIRDCLAAVQQDVIEVGQNYRLDRFLWRAIRMLLPAVESATAFRMLKWSYRSTLLASSAALV